MPITVHTYASLEKEEIYSQIERLYVVSPEYENESQAISMLIQHLNKGAVLYVAMFNDKIIGSVLAMGASHERILDQLVVHPANRGRGIARRLIEEVDKIENEHGVQKIVSTCPVIEKLLQECAKTKQL